MKHHKNSLKWKRAIVRYCVARLIGFECLGLGVLCAVDDVCFSSAVRSVSE
jgi:hypothetical protein